MEVYTEEQSSPKRRQLTGDLQQFPVAQIVQLLYGTKDSGTLRIETKEREGDYRVFFLADGSGSVSEELHLATLLNLAFGFAYVTTTNTVLSQLG